jgi:hypothetical protein
LRKGNVSRVDGHSEHRLKRDSSGANIKFERLRFAAPRGAQTNLQKLEEKLIAAEIMIQDERSADHLA